MRRPGHGCALISGPSYLGEHRRVVVPRVDVQRDGAGHRYVRDVGGPAVEQLPDALVAVQRPELGEDVAGERERVPASVLVAADRERRAVTTGEQLRDRLRG